VSTNKVNEIFFKMKSSGKPLTALSQIPLFVKISAVMILLVLLPLLVFGFFMVNRQKDILYQERMKAGKIILNRMVKSAAIPLLGDDALSLNTLVKEAMIMDGLLYVIIVDDREIIKAHTDPTKIGLAYNEFKNTEKIVKDENIAYVTHTLPSGVGIVNLSSPVSFANKTIGSAHVGLSLDYINKEVRQETLSLIQSIFYVSLFIVTIVMGTALFLSKRSYRQIAESILSSQENPLNPFLPEMKRNQVTVLFAGIKGFKAYAYARDPEEVLKDLNEYFAVATRCISDFGGHIDKFVGDAVIGVFGDSPVLADHTERAVRSAVAIQQALETAGKKGNPLLCKVGIGISSGVVLSGQIGSQMKKEYTFIGESFKAAYSLNLMAGPGEIIISKDVYQLIENSVSVEPLPPSEMTQKTGPWENFRLQRIAESKSYGQGTLNRNLF